MQVVSHVKHDDKIAFVKFQVQTTKTCGEGKIENWLHVISVLQCALSH